MTKVHLIVYTTQYRKGSAEFKRIAETMLRELSERYEEEVICQPIVTKKDLNLIFQDLIASNKQMLSYHFVGHAGMYGPMYGTVEYPEQYSPYEIKQMNFPFAEGGKAYFHCCRSARWFAPFFARTKGVESLGYYNYTTFTAKKDKFKRISAHSPNVYAIGSIGKKSHGYLGSLKKYLGFPVLEVMKSFQPETEEIDATYNQVAELYDAVFQDIKVREDEWEWITNHLPKGKDLSVLDIGCGNGALLKELSPNITKGVGIDLSENILDRARLLNKENHNLTFHAINGPKIPVEDQSLDLVISMLSFRYLDWDPLMDEIKRVLKPGGKILILDMVTVPVKAKEFPTFLAHKLKQKQQLKKYPEFNKNLAKLVKHPAWKKMLAYNPIRAEHEMKWYLESRFPGRKVEKINIGYHSCILAFDSGDIQHIQDIKLTYP
jgi:ubiquinone/menaquinone biosynthesis C-methylase UbiE